MKIRSLVWVFLMLFSIKGSSQSALFLNNDVLLTVEFKAIITVNGGFNAKNVADTALISNEGVIEMLGNWKNESSGKLTDNSTGNIIFKGVGSQTIEGNTAFYNLEIDNSAGVTVTAGLTEINNELQLTSGNFNTGGSVKLNAIASKTARIAPILTGSISGDVTIECFIENQAYDYRFLSLPVQNQTLDEWSDDLLMSGFIGTPYPTFNFNNVFFYNETLSGVRNARYENATNVTNPVIKGEGVQIYVGAADLKVDVTGEIYSGVVNFPVTFTDDPAELVAEDGWNLLGNPYPSTIDWSNPNWTRTNIEDAIYIYQGSSNNYQSYVNGVGTNGGTPYIPSSQGFWVKADGIGVPVLSANEKVKTSQETSYIERRSSQDLLRLIVSNGMNQDEIVVRYHPEASARFDPKWDASKVEGHPINPILTAIQRQESYSIVSMNPDSLEEVLLKVEVPTSGDYEFRVEQLPKGVNCLYLEDLFTGRIESLRDSTSFSFSFSDTTTVPRFRLTASKLVNYTVKQSLCYGDLAEIVAESNLAKRISLSWSSTGNNQVVNDSNFLKRSLIVQDGVYHFKANSPSCSTQENFFTINSPDSISVQEMIVADTGFNSGSVDLVILGGTAPYSISWGSESHLKGSNVSGLSAGNYQAKITDANGCSYIKDISILGAAVSIKDIEFMDKYSVYPNPAKDFIHVTGLENQVNYELFDGAGRVVLSGVLSSLKASIAVKQFNSGIYLLKLSSKEGVKSLKIKKVNE
ncbi:MAG: T9SS type A sorting domain-containing protein [Flavobacteriales bacterium]|nr:T9SS type A sorting domain-containing protein [Flavobacteriales bacterium]